MRTIRHRPRLRAIATATLCLALAACSQFLPRAAGPSDAPPADAPRAAPPPAATPRPPATPSPHPDAVVYAIDPVHTRIVIAIDHAGFSKAMGTVSGTTGTLHSAPGAWEGARVEASIPIARLDFGDEAWNRAVAARGLLDSERHPFATFRSTRVEPVGDDRARIHGQLDLRGTTRPVVLDAVRNAERRHPLPPFRRTVGFSATASLSRADFGSTAWDSVIGDTVDIRIEVEATR